MMLFIYCSFLKENAKNCSFTSAQHSMDIHVQIGAMLIHGKRLVRTVSGRPVDAHLKKFIETAPDLLKFNAETCFQDIPPFNF